MWWFQFKLIVSMAAFLATIAWEFLSAVRTALLYSLVVLATGWLLLNHLTAQASQQPQVILYPVVLSTAPAEQNYELSEYEIRQLLVDYQGILEQQPHHRDVLVNTALLYQALGEVEQSQYYWQQASLLDPNHHLFSQPLRL